MWVPTIAAWHNGKYFASVTPNGLSYILDIQEDTEGAQDLGALVTIDMPADAIHSGTDGILYFTAADGVYAWNESTDKLRYTWTSKAFVTNGATQFAALKVDAYYGTPVTVRVWCDGRLFDTVVVADNNPVYLNRNGRGIKWTVEVEGYTKVVEVHLSTSKSELALGQER
jgi:hypothetical protein